MVKIKFQLSILSIITLTYVFSKDIYPELVLELNPDNFRKISSLESRLDNSSIVMFSGNQSEEHSLSSMFNNIISTYGNRIQYGLMNCTAFNSFCEREIQVEVLPLLRFYPRNTRRSVDYAGGQEEEEILDFVQDHLIEDFFYNKGSIFKVPQSHIDQLTKVTVTSSDDILLEIEINELDGMPWDTYKEVLKLLEKYPNSPPLLYLLYQKTTALQEYEEAINILNRLTILLPNNWMVENLTLLTKRKYKEALQEATELEKTLYDENRTDILRVDRLFLVPEELMGTDPKVVLLQENVRRIKNSHKFISTIGKLVKLCAIQEGQIEGLYYLPSAITKQLVEEGITFKLILNGTGYQERRAHEVERLINDNILAFNLVEKVDKITPDVLKSIHLILTETVRFTPSQHWLKLIRRGKWKLLPNYLVKQDTLRYLVRPSLVEEYLNDVLKEVESLELKKVNPIVIATFFLINCRNISPFDGSNGLICRIVVGLILQRNDLVVFNVSPDIYLEYLTILEKSSATGDFNYIKNFIERQQTEYIETIENNKIVDLIKNY
jgi:hypothetical protein